ncbi:MAG: class I SAM-dependent methyltransferase [Sulfurospirillum sp.]|nr:class I SAM-dependent methyltransferase [Sulfurospirillum sp.]
MSKTAQKWNEKAQNYNRYDPDPDRFEAKVIQKIEELGVIFEESSLLDVGAGTGVYTLRLAQKAKNVIAMDFSGEMLSVLAQDAQDLGIKNILTSTHSWQDFECTQSFDIALSTMSPAIENREDFIKFHKCATTKIYLGWAGLRDSDVLNTLFEAHSANYTPPNGVKKLTHWLKDEKIDFAYEQFDELKISQSTSKDAIKKYAWHLSIRGVTPDERIIEVCLQDFCKDGKVVEKTQNRMGLLIWN